MSEPLRPTAMTVELIAVKRQAPANGAHVLALGKGGILMKEVWTSKSAEFFVAWMPHPKVSQEIKDLLMEQYKCKP